MTALQPEPPTDEKIDFQAIDGEVEHSSPEDYAGHLLEWAVECHSSDLFVSDCENSVLVAVRRMGRVQPVRRLARSYGRKLQGYLRVAAGSDAGDSLHPTEGRGIVTTPGGRSVDLRLSAMPTLFGMDVAVRLFDSQSGDRSIDGLGMDQPDQDALHELLGNRSGLILVGGPVASGKTSTMYAAVNHLNNGYRKIHTLEDPVERPVDGIMQTQVNLRAGLDFPDLLSAVLRHSPDVIMVGEIRDARTASTAVRAGTSGQLVLATLHSKNASDAVETLLHYGVNSKFLASSLIGVICQRLIRKLCEHCRDEIVVDDPFPIGDRVREQLGDEAPKLYRPKGCDKCNGDGFEKLVCVPEILRVNSEVADLIESNSPSSSIQQAAVDSGMMTLAEKAALQVVRGRMTAQDVNRAVDHSSLADLAHLSRDLSRGQ